MSVIIQFEHISKEYHLGAGQKSLRAALGSWPRRVLKATPAPQADTLYALDDVSFELHAGEVLGLVGQNGAGKTTVLKLLSRVTRPTRGQIHVHGRISALIELGAGFHPDLTGRENVYLNGTILGLSRREIGQRFDAIVDFAELADFIDTPVKRYSSGMYARLGFAVAAHTSPDLLLVDEVLAVGDIGFQRKCYDYLHAFVRSGKSAVFVSHNLYVVEQMCNRLLWLDHGRARMMDAPRNVLPAYFDFVDDHMLAERTAFDAGNGYLSLTAVRCLDPSGTERETFAANEDLIVDLEYRADHPVEQPHFVLAIQDAKASQPLFMASMLADGAQPIVITGEGHLRCRFGPLPLTPKVYDIWGEIWDADCTRMLLTWRRLGSFRVTANGTTTAEHGRGGIRHLRADAPVYVPYRWEY